MSCYICIFFSSFFESLNFIPVSGIYGLFMRFVVFVSWWVKSNWFLSINICLNLVAINGNTNCFTKKWCFALSGASMEPFFGFINWVDNINWLLKEFLTPTFFSPSTQFHRMTFVGTLLIITLAESFDTCTTLILIELKGYSRKTHALPFHIFHLFIGLLLYYYFFYFFFTTNFWRLFFWTCGVFCLVFSFSRCLKSKFKSSSRLPQQILRPFDIPYNKQTMFIKQRLKQGGNYDVVAQ